MKYKTWEQNELCCNTTLTITRRPTHFKPYLALFWKTLAEASKLAVSKRDSKRFLENEENGLHHSF